jgi:hypothetical protein
VGEEYTNPGALLDDLGVTCEQLFERFKRVGDHPAQQAMWNACQEFAVKIERVEAQIPDEFGSES